MKPLDRVYIRAGLDQRLDDGGFARLDCEHQRRLAIRIGSLGVRAGVEQHFHHSGVGQLGGLRDWRGSELISYIQVRLPGDQRPEQLVIDSVDCPVDRARTVGLRFIHIGHIGARTNPLERCLAASRFDKTGESPLT